MNITSYKVITKRSEGIYKEKGSKFIAIASAVYSLGDINIVLDEIRKEYYDARHHCYAYRMGFEGEEYRVNDDGEPSGSAGLPILGQMRSFNITNVLIVVVRYFGGTKLGVSGLIRAYKTSAREAIENNRILEKKIYDVYELKYEYPLMNVVMSFVKNNSLKIVKQEFELSCKLEVLINIAESKKIEKKLKIINGLAVNYLNRI